MESLKLSFEAIMPIFLLMLLGYFLKWKNVVGKSCFDAMNRLVFKVFLPVLLFYNIYQTELEQAFDWKLIAFAAAGILGIFLIGSLIVPLLTKDNARRGVMLQGLFRSNYAILGLPLVNYICGSTAVASAMVAVVIPMFNILAVVSLERYRGGNVNLKKLLKGVVTNPLIIGCAVGALFLALDIQMPAFLEKAVSDVSKIASPIAMIVLGASFTFSSVKGCMKELLITVSARLVLVPLVMLTLAVALGFRSEALACLLIVFGAPTAVASFSMAQQMGGDEKLAAQVVVISSAACLLTLFIWIFLLSHLRLF